MERSSTKIIADQKNQNSFFDKYFSKKNFNGITVSAIGSVLRSGLIAVAGKKAYDEVLEGHRWSHFATGLCMGIVGTIAHPLTNLKITIQSNSRWIQVTQAVKELGWRNLYKGCAATGLRTIVWHIINTPLYGKMKRSDDTLSSQVIKGAISSQIATLISYPFDYIATRQAQLSPQEKNVSILKVAKDTVLNRGVLGFFLGYRYLAVRVALCSVVIGPVMNQVLQGSGKKDKDT